MLWIFAFVVLVCCIIVDLGVWLVWLLTICAGCLVIALEFCDGWFVLRCCLDWCVYLLLLTFGLYILTIEYYFDWCCNSVVIGFVCMVLSLFITLVVWLA